MAETPPRDRFTGAVTGSVSFDCVNGRNAHLAEASVMRRLDRVHVWWHSDHLRAILDPPRYPVPVRNHPFCGVMRRQGLLTLFGPDGAVLSEDVVRILSVYLMPERAYNPGTVLAACYRYHPRPRTPCPTSV